MRSLCFRALFQSKEIWWNLRWLGGHDPKVVTERVTEPMANIAKKGNFMSELREFWKLVDVLKAKCDSSWVTHSVGFERRRIASVKRRQWTVCYKFHAIRNHRRRGANQIHGIEVSITIWPPKLTGSECKALQSMGWYKATTTKLKRIGFSGKWDECPHGKFGNFWKHWIAQKNVSKEIKILNAFRLPREAQKA